jgi:uncharacterized membrane protein YdjX (TVP38/TMEM64 family)
VNVAIARTEPAFANHAAITEIRQFYSDAIAAAQRYIFLENQYFSSSMLAALLAERLAQEQGPEVVVITPQRESGWLEENTMGALRAHIYQDLRERDTQQRFRPYCPIIANDDSDGCLNVHSKVMTVDDELLTVGSANLSNRSMSLDTECNLIIEACGQGDKAAAVRSAIAGLRNRLLAEHLATDAETVAAATDNSLIAAIEKLRGGERTLLPAQPQLHPSLKALVPHEALIDPEQPLEPEYVISQYLPQKDHAPVRGHATLIAIAAIFFGCLAFAWRATPLHDYLDIHTALRFVENLQAQPLTPLWMLLTYLIGGLLVVPVVLLIAVTGMVFGPWLGGLYALSGSLVSAALSYWIGRKLGRGALQRFLSRRLQRVNKQLTQRGLLAVVAIRLMPVAPFTIVNLLAGAAQIRLRDFLLGTAIGMLPGIVMTVIFVDRIAAAMRKPSPGSIVLLVVAIAIIVTITLLIQRWLRGERTEPSQNNSNGKDSAHVSEPPRP